MTCGYVQSEGFRFQTYEHAVRGFHEMPLRLIALAINRLSMLTSGDGTESLQMTLNFPPR
jgi:hypothetical protein